MHIVFISSEYPLWQSGGKGTFIQSFARALVRQGHKATVLGIGTDKTAVYDQDQGVQLIRLRKPILPIGRYLENWNRINKELKKINKTYPIAIVETSELDCAYLPKKASYKKVIRLHGGHHFFAETEKRGIDPIKGKREKKSFANTDGFIAVSKYVKEHTATCLSYQEKPIQIINNIIDTEVVIPEVVLDKNAILFAGTVCEKKGVNELIEAFAILRQAYPNKNLDIYGPDWKFPDGSSYIAMLKEKYKDKLVNVNFYGSVSRAALNEAYASSLLCVFPSRMETQGLVVLEAMLMEKPVIFSQYGPGPETIDDTEDGLLCDAYNANDIALKMKWIIENEQAALQMGKKARKKIVLKYNKQALLDANLNFYDSLRDRLE